MFIGFVPVGQAMSFTQLIVDASSVPVNSDVTPTYRVYGNSGLLLGGTGSLSFKETGSITGATNASPIVITSANHGLTTGMRVTITGVGGNTNANDTWTITVTGVNTFSLNGSTGNSAYTSGGTWKTTGLYVATLTPTTGAGYGQGLFYDLLVIGLVSSVSVEYQHRFGVI